VSWQPRDRARLDARRYFAAYDDLFARTRVGVRALHHTALNLGAIERYERGAIYELTNALIERYGLAWINEDLGVWSLRGKSLPYPLPPYLTNDGLRAAIANARDARRALVAPLLVEFPGFSDGAAIAIGTMHAYDFFRVVVEESDSAATLDTGHLLSYQWSRGRRGEALYDELERLPLEACFEIHLSGSAIEDGRFHDRHHGVLLDEQLVMLERLAALCPNLRRITYEDPVLDAAGALVPEAGAGFAKLHARWGRS